MRRYTAILMFLIYLLVPILVALLAMALVGCFT
jgi:hypothetical protein